MAWPFDKDKDQAGQPPKAGEGDKTPEKTPAELIAESVTVALKPVTEQLAGFASRMEQVEQRLTPKKPEGAASEPKPPAPPSFLDDEEGAFNARFNAALGPMAVIVYETRADGVKDRVRRSYGDTWTAFEKEIEEFLSKQDVRLRMNEAYVRNCVDMLVGRKAIESGYRFDEKTKKFFLEPAGGGTDNQGTPAPDAGLTERQRKAVTSFTKHGMTLDEYTKAMKQLEFVQ